MRSTKEITITPEILSVEPVTSNVVAITTKGEVDLSTVQIILNGKVCNSTHRIEIRTKY